VTDLNSTVVDLALERLRSELDQLERSETYADPLSHALGEFSEVTRGSSQLGEDGNIAFCGPRRGGRAG
jgi:hypothetical protein